MALKLLKNKKNTGLVLQGRWEWSDVSDRSVTMCPWVWGWETFRNSLFCFSGCLVSISALRKTELKRNLTQACCQDFWRGFLLWWTGKGFYCCCCCCWLTEHKNPHWVSFYFVLYIQSLCVMWQHYHFPFWFSFMSFCLSKNFLSVCCPFEKLFFLNCISILDFRGCF